MSYKIILDSCGELTEAMKKSEIYESVPLQITVGDYSIADDENFNQAEFLQKVAESEECPRSSCPSPATYMEKYHCDADRVYVITLTGALSGSYNSALLGKNLYHEEYGDKNIHVFNSCSASAAETLIAIKITECEEAGLSFEQIVETINQFIDNQRTFFILPDLDVLRKNGRLTGFKSIAAKALHIVPILGATKEGTIAQLGQALSKRKAMSKMAQLVVDAVGTCIDKTVVISHCVNPKQATELKNSLLEQLTLKDVIVQDMRGISSMYAGREGIIVTV